LPAKNKGLFTRTALDAAGNYNHFGITPVSFRHNEYKSDPIEIVCYTVTENPKDRNLVNKAIKEALDQQRKAN
jgi:hypothetical protein